MGHCVLFCSFKTVKKCRTSLSKVPHYIQPWWSNKKGKKTYIYSATCSSHDRKLNTNSQMLLFSEENKVDIQHLIAHSTSRTSLSDSEVLETISTFHTWSEGHWKNNGVRKIQERKDLERNDMNSSVIRVFFPEKGGQDRLGLWGRPFIYTFSKWQF